MLKQPRSVISRIATAPTAGKNSLAALWALRSEGTTTDPTLAVHEMSISQYARAGYEMWLPKDVLQTTFDLTSKELDMAKNRWGAVKGPIAAAILSARRLGWKFEAANCLTTDTCTQLDLTLNSPAYISQMKTEAVQRSVAKEMEDIFES